MVIKHAESSAPVAPGCVMCLFGVTGDLSKRLLLPSIYNLSLSKSLSDDFRLLGIGRKRWTDATLRRYVTDSLKQFVGRRLDTRASRWFVERIFYQQANFDEATSFTSIRERLRQIGNGRDGGSGIFYLALAPSFVLSVSQQLGRAGLFLRK